MNKWLNEVWLRKHPKKDSLCVMKHFFGKEVFLPYSVDSAGIGRFISVESFELEMKHNTDTRFIDVFIGENK